MRKVMINEGRRTQIIRISDKQKLKIAYACNGEGFGHASRMTTLFPHLEKKYNVSLFIPHSVTEFIRSKIGHSGDHHIPGIHFVHVHGRIDLIKSMILNLPFILKFPLVVLRLAKKLRKEGYQAVISDFEPHMAWAGRLAGLPVIQLNHPGVMKKIDSEFTDWAAVLVAYLMEGPWDKRILVSFFDGDVGPLLRPSLFKKKPKDKGFLVFNLKESYRHKVSKVLKKFPGLPHLIFPSKTEDFDKALRNCKGIITSAGHQIIAEALALGKPVLAIPQEGQPEQVLNARKLWETYKGQIGSLKTLEADLKKFIEDIPYLNVTKSLPKGFNIEDGTKDLLKKLDKFLSKIPASGTQANRGSGL